LSRSSQTFLPALLRAKKKRQRTVACLTDAFVIVSIV
jgi:hypothetical protein